MKKILYFMVGLIYLPITTIVGVVEYITNLGDTFISNVKFTIRLRRNMKENAE